MLPKDVGIKEFVTEFAGGVVVVAEMLEVGELFVAGL
jgi:hypothetical protein